MEETSLAIYIHWPFCKIKCPYCDFNSYKRESTNLSHWLKPYLKALELWSSRLTKREIKSIFFGGGTPSLLDPNFVGLVLQKIDSLWSINGNCEITIEANPNSVSESKFKLFREIGINRVSMGVQALNNNDLINLGRDHNKKQAIEAKVVKYDDQLDLALLKINSITPFVYLSHSKSVPAGMDVVTIGYPQVAFLGITPKITRGIVNSNTGLQDDKNSFQFSAEVQQGNSGGPLVAPGGTIVGVVQSKLDALKLSEKTNVVF